MEYVYQFTGKMALWLVWSEGGRVRWYCAVGLWSFGILVGCWQSIPYMKNCRKSWTLNGGLVATYKSVNSTAKVACAAYWPIQRNERGSLVQRSSWRVLCGKLRILQRKLSFTLEEKLEVTEPCLLFRLSDGGAQKFFVTWCVSATKFCEFRFDLLVQIIGINTLPDLTWSEEWTSL